MKEKLYKKINYLGNYFLKKNRYVSLNLDSVTEQNMNKNILNLLIVHHRWLPIFQESGAS